MRGEMPSGIFGTVSAINNDTLTVTSKAWGRPTPESAGQPTALGTGVTPATVVYTVDATNATIYKGSATTTVSISDIAVGDSVVVQGTVSGTNIAATVIRDGVGGMMRHPGMGGKGFGHSASSTPSSTPIIQGNGEPVIGGNVTAISGTTLTVTNASNVTYSIDAASSTVVIKGVSSTLSNVAVGDNVIVQGIVNGDSVTASSIIDQGGKGANTSPANGQPHGGKNMGFGGFFGAIGGFFRHIFGF